MGRILISAWVGGEPDAPGNVPLPVLRSMRLLHASGISQAISASA
jgi:hypothetical protein